MSRELHMFEAPGATARVLITRKGDHFDLDVWVNRPDLFVTNQLADDWVQHEILPCCIYPGTSRTIRISGPGFKQPPIHIIE